MVLTGLDAIPDVRRLRSLQSWPDNALLHTQREAKHRWRCLARNVG
jgi:hypothetical protein